MLLGWMRSRRCGGGYGPNRTNYSHLMAGPRSRQGRAARRRKQRMGEAEHDLTAAQWLWLQQAWGGCAYCGVTGVALQKDCVLPISRGGRYTIGNVVPACRSCNTSKCNAEVTTWMRHKRLDEPGFLTRLLQFQAELAQQAGQTRG